MITPEGFAHPAYAAVFRDWGEPYALARSGGSVLLRNILHTDYRDAMGCHPLFCCRDWSGLGDDLDDLAAHAISAVMVPDPFDAPDEERLRRIFTRVTPFKTHYVTDLAPPIESYVPRRRLASASRAMEGMQIGFVDAPHVLADWLRLQEGDAARRLRTGFNTLTEAMLERFLSVPGVFVLAARYLGKTVGMHLGFHQGDIVYPHLGAFDDAGYRLGASAAMQIFEIRHFTGKARFIDWGGVPGAANAETGLSRFKQDFSNMRRMTYLCAKILNPQAYDELSRRCPPTAYFPAYRAGEMTGGGP
ncbi:GNAT family N-acetyltransferase [Aestuariivirga sp.]|uniref:GNAT family N-acetyltransferase n=1 Tax=Aestuariivirga sp. TaxID=2650926 RepID=UPI0039E477C9